MIVVHGGYSQSNGKLAGTTTMLDAGWHSLMGCGHLSENRAALAVTRTPAECFGFHDRGILQPGKRADLAVFECGTNRLLPALAASALTVILHWFIKNPLVSIISGTALFMLLI